MSDLEPVDPAANPFLSGRFEPVHREIDTSDVTIEGDLPSDLVGTCIRNGPNPKYTPLGSYSYPMEGDGMLHAVTLGPDGVRYRNRWVQTNGLKAEERAGKALFGGLMTPSFVDQSLLGPDPDPGWPYKINAFINVIRHDGRYLALDEGTLAYEVTDELGTVGRYDFGGALAKGVTAHPKRDPVTGELVVFRYDIEAPFLTWAILGPDGSVVQPETTVPDVEVGHMIHDFAITEHHLLLLVAPLVFDVDAMLAGGPLLAWKPEQGCRLAVIRRDGSGMTWVESEAFWVWHFGNAHEQDGVIALDYPEWTGPGLVTGDATSTCRYVHARVDPATGTFEREGMADAIADFPRVDDRRVGRAHRYTVLTAASGRLPHEHDVLCRADLQAGTWQTSTFDGVINEPVFAPRAGGGDDELDGYYLAFVTTFDARRSSLAVWDAAELPSAPRALVHLPQRVPNGLHGNWFAAG